MRCFFCTSFVWLTISHDSDLCESAYKSIQLSYARFFVSFSAIQFSITYACGSRRWKNNLLCCTVRTCRILGTARNDFQLQQFCTLSYQSAAPTGDGIHTCDSCIRWVMPKQYSPTFSQAALFSNSERLARIRKNSSWRHSVAAGMAGTALIERKPRDDSIVQLVTSDPDYFRPASPAVGCMSFCHHR